MIKLDYSMHVNIGKVSLSYPDSKIKTFTTGYKASVNMFEVISGQPHFLLTNQVRG